MGMSTFFTKTTVYPQEYILYIEKDDPYTHSTPNETTHGVRLMHVRMHVVRESYRKRKKKQQKLRLSGQ